MSHCKVSSCTRKNNKINNNGNIYIIAWLLEYYNNNNKNGNIYIIAWLLGDYELLSVVFKR